MTRARQITPAEHEVQTKILDLLNATPDAHDALMGCTAALIAYLLGEVRRGKEMGAAEYIAGAILHTTRNSLRLCETGPETRQ